MEAEREGRRPERAEMGFWEMIGFGRREETTTKRGAFKERVD